MIKSILLQVIIEQSETLARSARQNIDTLSLQKCEAVSLSDSEWTSFVGERKYKNKAMNNQREEKSVIILKLCVC